jgi:hypothetical protein
MQTNSPVKVGLCIALAIAALACASTPGKRIAENQTIFDGYPAEIQANLRLGMVDVGYDEDMVRMALGDPDETSIELAEDGETLIWGYTRSRSRVSVGLGGGSYGGRGGVGGGVGVGSAGGREYTSIVEFRKGKVTRVRSFDN